MHVFCAKYTLIHNHIKINSFRLLVFSTTEMIPSLILNVNASFIFVKLGVLILQMWCLTAIKVSVQTLLTVWLTFELHPGLPSNTWQCSYTKNTVIADLPVNMYN